MIAGVRVRDLERLSPRVLSGRAAAPVPADARARLRPPGRRACPVYILTAASQEMADLLARVLAFDGGLGSRSEIVDGHYTGRPAGPFNYREGKVISMRELAEREGIDLGASFAYSDSESDLPMLRAVGHAVVVNPDAPLRRIARRGGLGDRRAGPARAAAEDARRARRRHGARLRRALRCSNAAGRRAPGRGSAPGAPGPSQRAAAGRASVRARRRGASSASGRSRG